MYVHTYCIYLRDPFIDLFSRLDPIKKEIKEYCILLIVLLYMYIQYMPSSSLIPPPSPAPQKADLHTKK